MLYKAYVLYSVYYIVCYANIVYSVYYIRIIYLMYAVYGIFLYYILYAITCHVDFHSLMRPYFDCMISV